MKTPSRPLLTLHLDTVLQARVREAAGKAFSVRTMRTWPQLASALRAAPLTSMAIVDPRMGGRGELPNALRALLRDFPCAVVLAAVHGQTAGAAALRTLGEWGIAEVIAQDEDSVDDIARVLFAVRIRPLHDLIEHGLPEEVTLDARALLTAAAETAVTGGNGADLARTLHVSTRTLVRRCMDAHVPAPRQLLGWIRILLAAELLEDPARPVESIAQACGFASDGGLRRALRDQLGTGPRALRIAGPFGVASQAFLVALGRGRGRRARPVRAAACLRQGRGHQAARIQASLAA